MIRMMRMLPVLLGVACGGGRAESPESLAAAVFDAVRDGDQARFLTFQAKIADMDRQCPGLDASARAEVVESLRVGEEEAKASFDACRQGVRFAAARFLRADRSPSSLQNFRWTQCRAALTYEFLRVSFDAGGAAGSLAVTQVSDIGGRWVYQGGVRLCEGPAP